MLTTLYNSNYINTSNNFSFEKIISSFVNIVKKIKNNSNNNKKRLCIIYHTV